MRRSGMAIHQSHNPGSTVWITPQYILNALGGWQSFDFDPCAAPKAQQPWPTALRMNSEDEADGLSVNWTGRVWMNPPYTNTVIASWLKRMAEHNHGTALIFARTETRAFHDYIWKKANGLLFLKGRLNFYDKNGNLGSGNCGAPSVLCAYGEEDANRLATCGLEGAFVKLTPT